MSWIKSDEKSIIRYIVTMGIVFLIVTNFNTLLAIMGKILNVLSPIIIGGMIAFILNLPMKFFERKILLLLTTTKSKKFVRPVSILLSLIIIIFILFIVIYLVVPQLIEVINQLFKILPGFVASIQIWLNQNQDLYPQLSNVIESRDLDWTNLTTKALEWFNNFGSGIITSVLSTLGTFVTFVVNLLLSIMVALFILMGKENLKEQAGIILETYFPEKKRRQILYVSKVFKNSFEQFLVGELMSATTIGLMVTIGMWLLRFPYATMIGALTGVTSLIPYIGAYLSGAIGFLLIVVNSPIQGIAFIVFIIIVQQIEGNVLYPRIVGNTIGLPGLWVIVAITLGGGLMGILGMILFVPLFSALFKIFRTDIAFRQGQTNYSPLEEVAFLDKNNEAN